MVTTSRDTTDRRAVFDDALFVQSAFDRFRNNGCDLVAMHPGASADPRRTATAWVPVRGSRGARRANAA
jgi:hypothetical protein